MLNWNGADNTIRCLESLEHLNYPNYRLLVVDNASMDDSVASIQAAFPDVEILSSDANLGYAGGNRLALEKVIQGGAELFWILNNDTTVEPYTLTALVEAYYQYGLAVYGSVILQPGDHRLIAFSGGWALNKNGCPSIVGKYNPLFGISYTEGFPDQQPRLVSTIEGGSLLVPTAVIRQHGFMDESFFMNNEELDYCFRLGKKGIPSVLVPRSIVIHKRGGSYRASAILSGILEYYQMRNNLVFTKRHGGWRLYVTQLREYFIGTWRFQVLAFFSPRKAQSRSARAYLLRLAVYDAIRNRMGKRFAPEDYLEKM